MINLRKREKVASMADAVAAFGVEQLSTVQQ